MDDSRLTFSIVTPVYQGERFLSETIESVLAQRGDLEIEYIVMDGGSTDRTLAIAREYRDRLERGDIPVHCRGVAMRIVSRKDRGMYDAINEGFGRARGDVLAWLNADDRYLPGALEAIARAFAAFPRIEWIKGITCVAHEDGTVERCLPSYIYHRDWIARGIYGRYAPFIHQDSVFWRRALWEKAGPIDPALRLAGDWALWIALARHAPLYSLNRPLSVFRRVAGSLSAKEGGGAYRAEQARIRPPHPSLLDKRVRLYFWLSNHAKALDAFWRALYPVLFWGRREQYIEWERDAPALRKARSYVV